MARTRRAAPNRSCSTRSAIGDLVHMVLDRALRDLEAGGGLASADAETIEAAVARAAQAVAADWESERRFRRPSSGAARSTTPA